MNSTPERETQDFMVKARSNEQDLVMPKMIGANERSDVTQLNSNVTFGTLRECVIGFSIEDAKELKADELAVAFKMSLKRLIKFRERERKTMSVVPSVPNDP